MIHGMAYTPEGGGQRMETEGDEFCHARTKEGVVGKMKEIYPDHGYGESESVRRDLFAKPYADHAYVGDERLYPECCVGL